ncbi:MAG TPA: CsgG/HfaB family protein [Fibrobacteraceae bacterium]|nr:CsgG/HfaB family protein [Fibrobacteraceae bacterium]
MILITSFFVVALFAQDSTTPKPNIAVIDFTGDQTVTPEQLSFITRKISSGLIATGNFVVLERGKMDYILKEQGFQQSGVCNSQECHVQVGQLLGVDNLVDGSLVRFGTKYAMHIEYLDVGSGEIVKSVDLNEKGKLEDVYETLCNNAVAQLMSVLNLPVTEVDVPTESEPMATVEGPQAKTILEQPSRVVPADAIPKAPQHPMSTKRKIALALWGTSLASAGVGFYFNNKGVSYQDDYEAAASEKNSAEILAAYNNTQDAEGYRNASYGVSIGALVLGAVLWFLPEGK